MSQESNQKISPTAQVTPDVVGLGQTSGQRTAEIFAGLRAELMKSPEVKALSRFSGRVFARIISALATPKILNFVPLRLNGFMALCRETLEASSVENPILVETAAGFAPRGILLAKEMPNLKVIEVDLPGVIDEKRRRLASAHIEIPPNLEWRHADLGVTPLSEVLDGQKVDIITAEGLLHYFSYNEITSIAKYFHESLKPDGSFICDIGYRSPAGQQETSGIISFFSRKTQSNPSKGIVTNKDTAEMLFVKAGYNPLVIYTMPEISEKYDLAKPAPDYLFFVQAYKPDSASTSASATASKDDVDENGVTVTEAVETSRASIEADAPQSKASTTMIGDSSAETVSEDAVQPVNSSTIDATESQSDVSAKPNEDSDIDE